MRNTLLMFCLALSLSAYADYYPVMDHTVFGSPAVLSDEPAIDKLMSELWGSWAAHDANTFASLHTKDAEWTNAFGRTFVGSSKLEEFLAERLFSSFDIEIAAQEAASYTEVSRRYIGSKAAVITGRVDSNRGSSVGSSNRKIGFTFVLAKIDGQWKVTNQVITDIRERRG